MNRTAAAAIVLVLFASSLAAQDTIDLYSVNFGTSAIFDNAPSNSVFSFDVTTQTFLSFTVTYNEPGDYSSFGRTFDFTAALTEPYVPYSLTDCGWSLGTAAGILNALLNPQDNGTCTVDWVALAVPNPLLPAYDLALSIDFCDKNTESACQISSTYDQVAAGFFLYPPDGVYPPVSSTSAPENLYDEGELTVALESIIYPPGNPAPSTPEASTFGLFGVGLLTLAGIRFRRVLMAKIDAEAIKLRAADLFR